MEFIKKHKKAFIITGVILFIFIILLILMFTVFSLKKVEVKCLTSTNVVNEQMQEEIVSKVSLGGTVLFKDKEKIVKDIEKEYPYVNVVNIETVFPNKFVINIAERESLFLLNDGILLDSDLKVLSKEETNAISLNILDLDFDENNISAGQFLNFKGIENVGAEIESILKNFASMCNLNNKNNSDLKSLFSKIYIKYYTDFRNGDKKINLQIIDKNNFEINVYNPLENYEDKMHKMFYAYSDLYSTKPEQIETSKLIVFTNLDGENCAILESA